MTTRGLLNNVSWCRLLLLSLLASGSICPSVGWGGTPSDPPSDLPPTSARYYHQPLRFEANQGQTDAQARFLARGQGYSLLLTPSAAVLGLKDGQSDPTRWVRLALRDSAADPVIRGEEQLAARSNYFVGNDPARWRSNVPTFGRVRYRQVYPGIDLVYYGQQGQLENDFEIAAGANPKRISWRVEGDQRLWVEPAGDLVISSAGNDIRLEAPHAYQQENGQRRTVAVRYQVSGQQVGFELGSYNRRAPLVIDPVLTYSTYLGGTGGDAAYSVAVNSAGNAYVTGVTASVDFPVSASIFQDASAGDGDVFVTEFTPDGSNVVFSTYLGGAALDIPAQIQLDATGNVYLVGNTLSNNFPVTAAAMQATYGGNQDGFLTELKPDGSGLIYSTYIGGTQADLATAMAFDAAGDIYIVGSTQSTDFFTMNPIQLANDGQYDVFLVELSSAGALKYSTYLGGSSSDYGTGIGVDSAGNVYLSGTTYSSNFPTQGALQATFGGGSDVFVTKFTPGSSALLFSTFIGGSSIDRSSGMVLDANANIYLTGDTQSKNFPVTSSAYQSALMGTDNAFLTKLSSDGSTLVFSTLYGGSQTDQANGLALDATGNIYLTGYTQSSNFPRLDSFQNILGIAGAGNCGSSNLVNVAVAVCPDGFVVKFGPSGLPVYASFLGGSNADAGEAIAVDATGAAYVVGQTYSSNFPTIAGQADSLGTATGGSYQWQYHGSATSSNAFVAKISAQDQPSLSLNPQQINFGQQPLNSASTPITVNLTNAGSTALAITSVTTSGNFSQTNNCGTSLAGGSATCTVQVTFTPASVGLLTGQLTITEPGAGTSTLSQSITLTGTGVTKGGSLEFSPTSLTFPAQPVGSTSAPQTALLINNGNQAVTITNITAGNGFAQTNNCGINFPTVPATLNVGQSCTVSVSFSPTSTGSVTGSIAVASNAVLASTGLSLTGTGSPIFSLSSNARSNVILIGTKTASFTISASAPSTFTGNIGLSCSTGATCSFSPSSIAPGASSELTVTGLSATSANPMNFTVTGNAGAQGSASVALTLFFADFSLAASPSGTTVTAGKDATYTIVLTPTNGFSAPVLMSCGRLPQDTTCYWNPGGMVPSGTGTVSTTLVINTTSQSSSKLLHRPSPPGLPPALPRWVGLLALLTLAGAAASAYGGNRRRRWTWAVLGLAVMLAALALGCENYVNPININPQVTGTPSGTFSIALTGTVGNGINVTRTTIINLSVLPST